MIKYGITVLLKPSKKILIDEYWDGVEKRKISVCFVGSHPAWGDSLDGALNTKKESHTALILYLCSGVSM